MHTELAKCEEAEDQLEYAVTHLRKALELDDSGMYYDRLQTALTRLQLRATLYKTPERAEDLAAMIIEQVQVYEAAWFQQRKLLKPCSLLIGIICRRKGKELYFKCLIVLALEC